jgi:DNA-binding NtrC family response regulator
LVDLAVFLSLKNTHATIQLGGTGVEIIYSNNDELVGNSEAIKNIDKAIKLLEGRDFRVALISGEIGTQKKIVASILHHHSARRNRPLVNVDCSTTSGPWLESALDIENKSGIFADTQGILCLQNIEVLSLKAQASLLRHLEQSSQNPQASSLIALTRTELKKAVKDGRFLLELYEYLSRFHLHMPPLRDRIMDIAPLTKKLLRDLSATFRSRMFQVDQDVLDLCSKYNWPGNMRELGGMLEQVVLHYPEDTTFRIDHIPHYLQSSSAAKVIQVAADMKLPRQGVVLEELERSLLKQALEQMLGNQSRAARLLGISRFALRYRMEKYGLFPKTKSDILAAADSKWSE